MCSSLHHSLDPYARWQGAASTAFSGMLGACLTHMNDVHPEMPQTTIGSHCGNSGSIVSIGNRSLEVAEPVDQHCHRYYYIHMPAQVSNDSSLQIREERRQHTRSEMSYRWEMWTSEHSGIALTMKLHLVRTLEDGTCRLHNEKLPETSTRPELRATKSSVDAFQSCRLRPAARQQRRRRNSCATSPQNRGRRNQQLDIGATE